MLGAGVKLHMRKKDLCDPLDMYVQGCAWLEVSQGSGANIWSYQLSGEEGKMCVTH